MKKLIIALTLIVSFNSFADCKSIARSNKIRLFDGKDEAQAVLGIAGYVTTTAVLLPLIGEGAVLAGGLGAVALPGAYIIIRNGKSNRLVKFIEQAEDYVSSNGSIAPGKLLVKAHKKIENNLGKKISILDVARFVVDGNEKEVFCPNGKFTAVRKILKGLENIDTSVLNISVEE